MNIERRGRGKPLLLLHAYPLTAKMWDGLGPYPGWELIMPDFPGFGSSSNYEGDEEFTLGIAAQALVSEVENMVGKSSLVLGGISMGGYLAFEVLRLIPDRVLGLLLISTRAGLDLPENRKKRLEMAYRAELEGISWLPKAVVPGLVGETTRNQRPEVLGRLEAMVKTAKPSGISLAQRAMAGRRDQTAFCHGIRQKTLILAGREDTLIPVEEAELLHRLIPKSQLEVLDKVGHLPPLENPSVFSTEVEKFLFELPH